MHWPKELTFVAGDCSSLLAPANGDVTWNGLRSGSIATYTCDVHYQLTGDETRTCLNRTWSGQEPTCKLSMVNSLMHS